MNMDRKAYKAALEKRKSALETYERESKQRITRLDPDAAFRCLNAHLDLLPPECRKRKTDVAGVMRMHEIFARLGGRQK